MRILARHPLKDEGVCLIANPDVGALMTTNVCECAQFSGQTFKVVHQEDVGSKKTSSLSWSLPPTPPKINLIFSFIVLCEAEAKVSFYENLQITANTGTLITPVCVNRTKVYPCTIPLVYANATINTVNAVLLDIEVIGNGQATGGVTVKEYLWTLCGGKTYAVAVENKTAALNETTIKLECSRHIEP